MILVVAGTRPNFMKIAPIMREMSARDRRVRLMHTGQHFDAAMSDVFFADLGIAQPDVRLSAGGGTQAEQTSAVMIGVEKEIAANRPEMTLVVGDVTSTMAAAVTSAKAGVPVVHVEAGLRSRDWTMPEEINRVVTDAVSDLLLTTSADAETNLVAEGVPRERIRFVGNVMIDSLHYARERPTDAVTRFGMDQKRFALVTLHRPANVDEPATLTRVLDVLEALAARVPVLFPVHPRTVARAEASGLANRLRGTAGLHVTPPLGYNDFATLLASCTFVATDSGGIQEESTALGVPCLTMRQGTERPITVEQGTNVIVGLDRDRILVEVDAILAGKPKQGRVPEGWDGHAARRVVDALDAFASGSPRPRTAGPRA